MFTKIILKRFYSRNIIDISQRKNFCYDVHYPIIKDNKCYGSAELKKRSPTHNISSFIKSNLLRISQHVSKHYCTTEFII
uniref:Uncharacterized protein n=1 Tax=Pararge aegeria TaxID=116150 RepID=S4NXB0_9NEOP